MRLSYLVISFLVGFLSLGQEIVWVKIVSFASYSVPQAFAFVLMIYILGIALGAHLGKLLSMREVDKSFILAGIFAVSGASLVVAPALILVFRSSAYFVPILALIMMFGAGLKGCVFPLVHHWYSSSGERLGRSLSTVYFCNVAGAAFGPMLVGFVMLDILPMATVMVVLGAGEVLIAVYLVSRCRSVYWGGVSLALLPIFYLAYVKSESFVNDWVGYEYSYLSEITNVIENRHGVIYTIADDFSGKDKIYGGNVYDGAFNTSLTQDVNGISRAYILAALKRDAEDVLFIGLSSGSWLQVVASFPSVKSIDVVEINSGYKDLMSRYPGADILNDSRVSFFHGDGRQYVSTIDKKYDLVVMNNTWHWRAYSTNLLSHEFMVLLKGVMKKGGVATFNTTGSIDVLRTASESFPFSYKYLNFAYVSDMDLRKAKQENRGELCLLSARYFPDQNCSNRKYLDAIDNMYERPFVDAGAAAFSSDLERSPEVISDNNMITEYKYGRGFSLY